MHKTIEVVNLHGVKVLLDVDTVDSVHQGIDSFSCKVEIGGLAHGLIEDGEALFKKISSMRENPPKFVEKKQPEPPPLPLP